ncbi:hypothetical protein GCM10027605_60920 [Micromonospora zhanjiangensis]
MAALRNAAIGALRLTGVTNIAAANRHHARDSTRPLALLGITLTTLPGRVSRTSKGVRWGRQDFWLMMLFRR